MNKRLFTALAAGTFGLGLAACSNNGSTPPSLPIGGGNGKYVQIERLSRPAVKELFEKFVDHQVSNAAEPYNDPTLQGEIQSFTDALRPPKNGADYGATLAKVADQEHVRRSRRDRRRDRHLARCRLRQHVADPRSRGG
jgi:hypothetical protein